VLEGTNTTFTCPSKKPSNWLFSGKIFPPNAYFEGDYYHQVFIVNATDINIGTYMCEYVENSEHYFLAAGELQLITGKLLIKH